MLKTPCFKDVTNSNLKLKNVALKKSIFSLQVRGMARYRRKNIY